MARSKSSGRWLREHFDDPYVKQAQSEGWRSRAAFKLLELQDKYRLIRSGMCVVDLGAAPGGWSQVAAHLVGQNGKVVALDVLPMEPLSGVLFIQGDFTEDAPLAALEAALEGQSVDLVKPGGDLVTKVFQGEGFDEFLAQCRQAFDKVLVRKPKASRPRSREVYLLGRGRKLD
jgi:23S rRNA (uridine2552-2'-O)-methyltransferase